MKKYILASDYDGTLYQRGEVTKETIDAINKFRQAGNFFGVVTGRDYVNGFEVFRRENLFPFDFIITSNGATAYDKDGNIYFAKTVNGGQPFGESTVAQELVRQIFQLTSNCCSVSVEKKRYEFHPDYPLGAKVGDRQYSAFSVLKDVDEFVSANVVCDTIEQTVSSANVLREKFSRYINPLQNDRNIDISPAGVDKAAGITLLADCLGIAYEDIWTAGDNLNDITMLEKFHGCAMASGVKALAKVSEYVCDNVADVIELILTK